MNMRSLLPNVWQPANGSSDLLSALRQEIDRAFESFGRSLPGSDWPKADPMPKINVTQKEKALVVTAELPGVDSKDVDVLVDRGAGALIAAHERPVRSAGQIARLFPHRTVRQNILYGSGWTAKPTEQFELADRVMELFRLRELAERMPRDLSGGERQRVSVARAVMSAITFRGPGAALLLLDEPFSGLDVALRDELLAGLREWLARWKTPVLSVTHDVGEAFQLDAEVIKIADGRVVQQGPVGEVLAEERQRLMEQLRG